jgi:hypothetical protein
VFGGIPRSVDAATATAGASIYDRGDVLLTLLAERRGPGGNGMSR